MFFTATVLSAIYVTAYAADFCYDEGHCDPYAWGDTYPTCHPLLEGHHSPINLDRHVTKDVALDALRLHGFDSVHKGQWTLSNDGHSIVLDIGSGMAVSGGGLPGSYQTVQLHFHWGSPSTNGSEHTMDTQRFPMEMHVVNVKSVHPNLSAAMEDPTGLAVLGVFIDVVYGDNVHFSPISKALPSIAYKGLACVNNYFLFKWRCHFYQSGLSLVLQSKNGRRRWRDLLLSPAGQTTAVRPFPLIGLLPQANLTQYYRYHGSLTTPPCSQVVVWTVYEVPVHISWGQLEQFTGGVYVTEEGAEHGTQLRDNFRHIHPVFSRVVHASRDARLLAGVAAARHASGLLLLLLPAGLCCLTPGLVRA
ncbi:carbonic anhydrase 15 isoform X1 [Denticeps clupeoides]|uniref:carbonic anhydrase 15 isoform X1 n=1 Tax=Denticeps clupeoides TaxID=299321 RepID=UPI0010A2B024|nr:carbonic anhydrase 15-like isoform X1 [Denticeps clupeoides]